MALPTRALVVLALFFGCACAAWSQTPSAKSESNGSVTGKVTLNGKPAPGIVIGMHLVRPENSSPTYKATTNQDGVYLITDVMTGTYVVAPVAPAMLKRPAYQTVVMSTKEDTAEDINFDLIRGGVITGKVTDADGRPLIDLSVELTSGVAGGGNGTYHAQTDDRGIYRIFGLEPGPYRVSVVENKRWSRGGPAYPPVTYYPDTNNPAQAKSVQVTEGAETANIDVKVGRPEKGYSVTGRVVDEAGNPMANWNLGLSKLLIFNGNRVMSQGAAGGVVTDAQGKFKITEVRPGDYELSVYPSADSDLRQGEPVSFKLVDADINDLVLKLIRGALISGTVVVEGPRKPLPDVKARLIVMAYVKDEGSSWSSGTQVKPDGSFVISSAMAGTLTLRVGDSDGHNGFTLSRIERDGVPQPNAVQLGATDHLTGLRLFVTYTSGSISGQVKISNGVLPPGTRVVLQLVRAEDPNFGFGGIEPDARGHFLFEGVAAGSYELMTMVYEANRFGGMTRQAVTVTDGAVIDVTVTVDLTPSPKP